MTLGSVSHNASSAEVKKKLKDWAFFPPFRHLGCARFPLHKRGDRTLDKILEVSKISSVHIQLHDA